MESREEFYKWKKRIDKKLNDAIIKLEALELKLIADEQEIDKKLNEVKRIERRLHISS